jgi:hypothetical protein
VGILIVDWLPAGSNEARDFTEANEGNEEPTAGFLLPVEFHELVNVIH